VSDDRETVLKYVEVDLHKVEEGLAKSGHRWTEGRGGE